MLELAGAVGVVIALALPLLSQPDQAALQKLAQHTDQLPPVALWQVCPQYQALTV